MADDTTNANLTNPAPVDPINPTPTDPVVDPDGPIPAPPTTDPNGITSSPAQFQYVEPVTLSEPMNVQSGGYAASNGTANGSTLYLNNNRASLTAGDAFQAGLRTDNNWLYLDANKGVTGLVLSDQLFSFTSNGTGFVWTGGALGSMANLTDNQFSNNSYITKSYADSRLSGTLAAPANATAGQVLTYNGTVWGAANATGGGANIPDGTYQPALANMVYESGRVLTGLSTAYSTTGEFNNSTVGTNLVTLFQGVYANPAVNNQWHAGAYGTSTTTGNLTSAAYVRTSRSIAGLYTQCGTLGAGGTYPNSCLTVANNEFQTTVSPRTSVNNEGTRRLTYVPSYNFFGLTGPAMQSMDQLTSSNGTCSVYLSGNATHYYHGRYLAKSASDQYLQPIQDANSILTRSESDARYAPISVVNANLAGYVPKYTEGELQIVSFYRIDLNAISIGGSTGVLRTAPADIKMIFNDEESYTFARQQFNFTSGTKGLHVSDNQFSYRNPNGSGHGFYWDEQGGLQEHGTAPTPTPQTYATRGWVNSEHIPKVSAAPITIEAVDEFKIRGSSGQNPSQFNAIEVTPNDIKFVSNDFPIFNFSDQYLDFSSSGMHFNVNLNTFTYTNFDGNGFSYDDQSGLKQCGSGPPSLTPDSYATIGWAVYQDGLIWDQVNAISASVGTMGSDTSNQLASLQSQIDSLTAQVVQIYESVSALEQRIVALESQ